MAAKYRPINIHIYIPKDSPSWKPKWLKPESAVSSNVPFENEYSCYEEGGRKKEIIIKLAIREHIPPNMINIIYV